MNQTLEHDFVPLIQIKAFSEIDGLHVIRQLLKFKGSEIVTNMTVPFKQLEDMALVAYGLKASSSNRLYVSFYLNKFYRQNGLIVTTAPNFIRVPSDIYMEIQEEEAKFRK